MQQIDPAKPRSWLTEPKVMAALFGALGIISAPSTAVAQGVPLAPVIRAPGDMTVAGWRLVRTPGPDKSEVVSIMRTADIMKSDAEFAGMMIRCRPKAGLQIAFAVITPFPPRSKPKIKIGFSQTEMPFEAEVIPPGSLVALPSEAEVLAKGSWQSAKELTIDIQGEGERDKIHGVVPLTNLSEAVAQLQSSCP